MPPKIKSPTCYTKLDNATCLLALIVNRLPEETTEEPEGVDQDTKPDADAADEGDDSADESDDLEDAFLLNIERDEKDTIAELKNKLLDRLAETLARYKSQTAQGSRDAKHVSGTMMIPFEEEERVEMICAKNEGLDREDEIFLQKWKRCMESMAIKGSAREDDACAMLDLVFQHQKPRIKTYISWLRRAFQRTTSSSSQPSQLKAPNLKTITDACFLAGSRSWVDAHGLVYDIPINESAGKDQQPEAPSIEAALTNIDGPLSRIMDNISTVCGGNTVDNAWDNTVKRLMKDVFEQWQGIRTQAAVRGYLHRQFLGDGKGRRDAQNALTRLGRVYKCVRTFIHTAERVPAFRSITITPVLYKPPNNKAGRPALPPTPIEVAESMGIQVKGTGWAKHLNELEDEWARMWKEKQEKCHFHAELQTLYYHNAQLPRDKQQHAHPYIGCSRRNCAFCYLFIQSHGKFAVRGTHESILHRWDAPKCASFEPVVNRVLVILKVIIQYLFGQGYPIRRRELLAQSSKALSSAQFALDKEIASMERSPREFLQLGMGGFVLGDKPLIMKPPNLPGYAHVFDGPAAARKARVRTMTLADAELVEDNYLRRVAGLEPRGADVRPIYMLQPAKCRQCGELAEHRCSACRVRYCAKSCQRKHWPIHVFVCCVRNRPNDVDRLRILIRQWLQSVEDDGARAQMLRKLFADDDICRVFGFTQCTTPSEVSNLICIYFTLIKYHEPKFIQDLINELRLGQYLATWVGNYETYERAGGRDCRCLSWYTERFSTEFIIPDWDSHYLYMIIAVHITSSIFRIDDWDRLNQAEHAVVRLYTILFRAFNNIPSELSAEWINFGFCFCTSRPQAEVLANTYVSLAESGASLAEIAHAWKQETLLDLMESKGIDVSFLRNSEIVLRKPPQAEFGAYRLVAEVNHALSGIHCIACTKPCHFHSKYEPVLSLESEGDYGFTGANAWERWQLLRFYHAVFSIPGFSAREMQKARHDPDPETLETYLDSLVPGFRLGISNIHLADGRFPNLGTRVSFPNGAPECYCVVHSVRTPQGL